MSSRLIPEEVRSHPVRKLILAIVEREPGVSLLELLERVRREPAHARLAYASLWHHVRKLERFQMMVSRRSGRCRRYYSSQIKADPSSLALLQSPSFVLVARFVLERPGISQADLHRGIRTRATFSRQALAYFLGRLEGQRLVSAFRAARASRYTPTEKLTQLMNGFAGNSPFSSASAGNSATDSLLAATNLPHGAPVSAG